LSALHPDLHDKM